jgi:trimeric autotransporter adhesin
MKSAIQVVVVLVALAVLGSSAWGQVDVTGHGTAGQIPVWLGDHRIGNSVITQTTDGTVNVSGTASISLYVANTAENASGLLGEASAATGTNFGVQGISLSAQGFGVLGSSPNTGLGGFNQVCSSGSCTFTAGTAGVFATGTGGNLLAGYAGAAGGPTSSSSVVFRVDSSGAGYFDGGVNPGGADFAESVAVAHVPHRYEPGDLLVLDTSADRQLNLSSEPYSTLVAGIYSTKPGVLATTHKIDAPTSIGEVPLAIVGIVPCKASAENGPIQRGDLLVTSSRPGYAMKGTDRTRMLGAVVGKAMEPLTSGTGTIQVLVTLQ